MKKSVTSLFLIFFILILTLSSKPVMAQEGDMPIYFRDTLMGAGIGAFIGGLLLLTTDNKSDHWDYVVYGGLIGAVGGLAYSVNSPPPAMVEIKKGKVTVGLPAVHAAGNSRGSGGTYAADLIRFRY